MPDLVDLSICVMGHKLRGAWIRDVVTQLRQQHDRVEVVVDQGQYGTCWKCAQAAWETAERHDADWHLVLTEDSRLCHDFVRHVREALAVLPEAGVVSFIKFGQPPPPTTTWLVSPTVTGGNALAMPRQMRREFMRWQYAAVDPAYKHDDARIALFLLQTAPTYRAWYTNPCLVDHLGADLYSITGQHPPISRRAMRFAGIFPFTVDWAGGVAEPAKLGGNKLDAYGDRWQKGAHGDE